MRTSKEEGWARYQNACAECGMTPQEFQEAIQRDGMGYNTIREGDQIRFVPANPRTQPVISALLWYLRQRPDDLLPVPPPDP